MNSRFKFKLITALLCVAAVTGCATRPDTFTQKDPQVDLYAFKTFAFFGGGYTTPVGEQLKQATKIQLERLGYVYDERNPELRVNIMLAVRQRAEVRSSPVAGPLPARAWGASNVETVDYRYGTLAIDLVDTHRRSVVWRGVAQDRITRKHAQNVEETVRDAVRELFARYPRKV